MNEGQGAEFRVVFEESPPKRPAAVPVAGIARWSLATILLVALLAGVYQWRETLLRELQPGSFPSPSTAPAAPGAAGAAGPTQRGADPGARHPIEHAVRAGDPVIVAGRRPLPALAHSDGALLDAFEALLPAGAIASFLVPRDVVRRIVVAVDSVDRDRIPPRLAPLKHPPGSFVVSGSDGRLALGDGNAARYSALVEAATSIDAGRLVDVYVRFYPLFQQQYEELGYPGRHFNDRVVEAIDSLLATPEVEGPIELVQPKILYRFADPALESLPAGQKAMLRLGSANAERLKGTLRALRERLASRSPR